MTGIREAIQIARCGLDRFVAEFIIGPAEGGTRWLLAMTAIGPCSAVYSITAWSGPSDCLRSAALVEPIMIARGIAHSVNIITIW